MPASLFILSPPPHTLPDETPHLCWIIFSVVGGGLPVLQCLCPQNLVWTRSLRLDPTTREERENAGSVLLAGSSDARALVPVERAAVR